MAELQLNVYTSITDDDLDAFVRNIVNAHPQCGGNTINGHIRSAGIRVKRQALRDSIHQVDPGSPIRRARRVLRR